MAAGEQAAAAATNAVDVPLGIVKVRLQGYITGLYDLICWQEVVHGLQECPTACQ